MDPDFQRKSEAPIERVLLVDDDALSVAEIKSQLEPKFTVSVAKEGGQCFGSIRMNVPDIVLMQVILPGESGFEICEKMKQRNPQIPIMFLTEVDLDSAENLAQRVGADGYLTKPYDVEQLTTLMRQCANAVWDRNQDVSKEKGVIRFHCRCGQRLKESFDNTGKFVTCPECHEKNQVPSQSVQEFACQRASAQDGVGHELDPLRFVTVKCTGCSTFYRLGNVKGDWRKCPHCGVVQPESLSIVGAPMSRAALESSLRVLRVLTGKSKGKKMMLPDRQIKFGKGKSCDIRHGSKSVGEEHCLLTPAGKGILVKDLGSGSPTFIDGERVTGEELLGPMGVLRIGDLKFRLLGEDLSVEDELNRVQKWSEREASARDKGIRLVEAGKETASEAAQVIQQHWNITRRRLVDQIGS
jgi:two-component system, OmpR family, response regulator